MRVRAGVTAGAMLLLTAAVLAGAGESCTYSPDFANDTLVCGPAQACPKGYACATDNKCWKTGETPGGGGAHADAGGTGGAHMDASSDLPITTDPREGFVGTWTFNGGTVDATCTDGSAKHGALTGDYIVIGVGTTMSTVLAAYYCQSGWTMQLSSGNTMAIATSNQTCVVRTTDSSTPPVTTAYTWSPVTFSFTKTSATTASSTGHFTGPFSATDGTNGTCDVTFTGPLTKS